MNLFLLSASGLALGTALLHCIAGGATVAQPLLKSTLSDGPKYTNYYCWHIVSILLFALAGCFLLAALDPQHQSLGLLATALCACFALWSMLLVWWKRQSWLELPQWALFLPLATLGLLGQY